MKSSHMMIVFLLLLSPSVLFANEQEVVARTQALRILGGDEVTDPSQFPWIVSLTYGCSGSQSYICSGVLLNSKIVMTAAHCSSECEEDQVMFGYASVGLSRLNVGQEVRSLEAWSVPLDYTGGTDNDIALWRLNEEFTTVDEFAQLPEMNLGVNEAAMVAGWGLTSNGGSIAENLMVAEIEIQPDVLCETRFEVFDSTTQICAGDDDREKDTCSGDSGGPLFVDDVVYGITSYGAIECGLVGGAGYTKVYYFLGWIGEAMTVLMEEEESESESESEGMMESDGVEEFEDVVDDVSEDVEEGFMEDVEEEEEEEEEEDGGDGGDDEEEDEDEDDGDSESFGSARGGVFVGGWVLVFGLLFCQF